MPSNNVTQKPIDHQPLVSIIMPAYNAEHYICEAIQSILNQTYTRFELIITNDGSIDRTKEMIQSFHDVRIKVLDNKKNVGYLKTVNNTFGLCNGELITFQDADDLSSPNRLELQVTAFIEDQELGFCGTQCTHYETRTRARKSSFPCTGKEAIETLEQGETVIFCGASIMLRSEIQLRHGGYREFFDRIGAEDLDYFWTLLLHHKFRNLNKALYTYRHTPQSITKSIATNPLCYHSTEIALTLYWQNKLQGHDSLENTESKLKLIYEILRPYKNDPSLIYFRAAFHQLSIGNFKNYVTLAGKTLWHNGDIKTKAKVLLISVPLAARRFVPKTIERRIIKKKNTQLINKIHFSELRAHEDKGPLVSIYIPTSNRSFMLKKALQSCFSQTYSNIEIIVVDDASTDNTMEILEAFSQEDVRLRYLRNDTPRG